MGACRLSRDKARSIALALGMLMVIVVSMLLPTNSESAQGTDSKFDKQLTTDLDEFQQEEDSRVDEQLALLNDGNPLTRSDAIAHLASFIVSASPETKKRAARAICDRLQEDPNNGVRHEALDSLRYFHEAAKECIHPLIAILQNPDVREGPERRRLAAADLAAIGPDAKEAIPALNAVLKDHSDEYLRNDAILALLEIRPDEKELGLALIEAVGDSNLSLRLDNVPRLRSFADAARDHARTDLIAVIDEAAKALQAGNFESEAKRVRLDADLLRRIQPPWYQRLFAELGEHRVIAIVIAIYLGLFAISLALLLLYPLALLWISEALAVLSAAPKVNKVVGVGEAVFIFGLFRHHPRVLDAWVAKYLAPARKQFASILTVQQRETHVTEVPVEFDRRIVPGLTPKELKPVFSHKRTCLLIWGEGGSGKTSLACQIARWAMSDDKSLRFSAQRMLPILIEQDLNLEVESGKSALTAEIRGRLRELTTVAKTPSMELVHHLLERKRVLLIVDGLSELNDSTRNKVHPIDPDFFANALIVTSRREEDLDRVTRTVIHPHRIEGNRLSSFMEAYFSRCGKRELFDDGEFFEGCKRLSQMVGQRNTTVLLAKLFAEQMIAAKEQQASKDLPEDIPDLMLEYINRINREVSELDDRTVHAAAKTIAWECLRQSFRPTPASVDAAVKALGNGAKTTLEYMEDKLHLVETIGAARDRVRFALDPLAEYMAGLQVLETNASNRDAWREFLAQADAMPGAPEGVKGFLLAVRDCCQSPKGAELQVLEFVADELGERCGLSAESVR